MTLDELKPGESAAVVEIGGEGALRRHFLDMGIVPGVDMTLVKYAPLGDPAEYRLRGYELTLRLEDAKKIKCREVSTKELTTDEESRKEIDHPGIGEGGRFHVRQDEHPLPDDQTMTFALAGNQNSGKTTLFNKLTGLKQKVGNFPGVTIDRKDGKILGHSNTAITDLPGIYSMSPYSDEEIISRNFVLHEKPSAIIDIVDATNIERNLNLTLQLMELDRPIVLALNMMDEVTGNGGSVDINEMEALLGIPVVPIAAVNGSGVNELVDHALHIAKYQEKPGRLDFCSPEDHGGAVHRAIHAIMHLIEDHCERAQLPIRFAATKLAEGDDLVMNALGLDQNEKDAIEHIVVQMEKERGLDRAAAIADMRYNFIEQLTALTVKKPKTSKEHQRSQAIDKVLTNKWIGIPTFFAIMAVIFYLTFNTLGGTLQDLLDEAIGALGEVVEGAMTGAGVNDALVSLVIDGIFGGVGAVLSFIPIIVLLFFFLSLLEDTGYMARVAFVMDKWLRRVGLSGRSIVPMLLGFGCSVPAIMASRTLPSERDRRMTVLLTPFMSCTAKLPIYGLFIGAFFPDNGASAMMILYLSGIVLGLLVAFIGKNTIFRGEAVPFVMELPNYRMPSARNVWQLLWEKTRDWLERAFTVIFLATMVIWFLQSFDWSMTMVEDTADSMLASIAVFVAPIFAPLGFGDWRVATALVTGFLAKEAVVSTLSVLIADVPLEALLTTGTCAALLAFTLLYTPCAAAIATFRQELGGKFAFFVVIFQCVVAWIIALIVRLIFLALGYN